MYVFQYLQTIPTDNFQLNLTANSVPIVRHRYIKLNLRGTVHVLLDFLLCRRDKLISS